MGTSSDLPRVPSPRDGRPTIGPPPRSVDGDVALRPIRVGDAAALAAAFVDDPDLGRLLGTEADPSESDLRARIARREQQADVGIVELAIVDAATDACWGSMLLHSFDAENRRGELGFYLVPIARRAGRGSRAVALALRWLFEDLDLLRVEMTTTPDNEAIRRLAAKLGFSLEGTMRARNVERGVRVDVLMFGLLREEWQAASTS
jgi:RimJ/RimL family protein N-acetyltransferase